ncbi:MAG: hypothetical protein ACP6IY_09905 [Promethearchaeia archaeon]
MNNKNVICYEENFILPFKIKEKRSFFIANRVAFSILLLFLLTGILTSQIVFSHNGLLFLKYWYIFIFFIPVGIIFYIYKKKTYIYYRFNWTYCLFLISLIWLSYSLVIGVFVDLNFGYGKTMLISFAFAFYYIMGYYIAWIIRRIRFYLNKKLTIIIFIITSVIFSLIIAIIGFNNHIKVMEKNSIKNIDEIDHKKFSKCFECYYWALFACSGFAITFFILSNYFMLYSLFQGKNWHISNNPPNRLFLCYLGLWTFILLSIWTSVEFFFPPVFGGGGEGGDGGGGMDGGGGDENGKDSEIKHNFNFQLNEFIWSKYHLAFNNLIEN